MRHSEPGRKGHFLHIRELMGQAMMGAERMQVRRQDPFRGTRHQATEGGGLDGLPFLREGNKKPRRLAM